MGTHKYVGYEKVLNEALVAARSGKMSSKDEQILMLERKLETAKLSNAEVAEIQKQLKRLRSF